MVLHRTEVRRWEMFSDMFNSLCILVSNPTGQGRWSNKQGSIIYGLRTVFCPVPLEGEPFNMAANDFGAKKSIVTAGCSL